jgi:uncharacterized protein (TIGR00369 family)
MAQHLEELEKLMDVMIHSHNDDHFHALGIEAVEFEQNRMTMKVEYKESLIGNPDTGVIHGGVITSLLDTTCGFAAATALGHLGLTPTIDLRIDYMRPAEPNKTIYAVAEVYRNTKTVIFTKGIAHQGDPDKPIAHAIGNFVNMGAEAFEGFREVVLAEYDKLESGNE